MNWQTEWRKSLRTADDLAREGLIPHESVEGYGRLLAKYQFALPLYYANLIDRSDPGCPIRRQAVPSMEELEVSPSARPDPLEDLAHRPTSRITHRYRNRALLHLTPNCSMYCRYCFRKTLLNEWSGELFGGGLEEAFQYLATHPEIEEVILSGGDPLMVGDGPLSLALERLSASSHLKRLRIHSRVPVTFPERITSELVESLRAGGKPLTVVTHFNHPRELTAESLAAVKRLREVATVLNQSVLLEGVNADADTLEALCARLFDEGGVLPYYLHHPDPAAGTGHFDVTMEQGLLLHAELRRRLPGYMVPRYVVDVVSEPYKQPVEDYLRRRLL